LREGHYELMDSDEVASAINPALIGKAGETLVAAELLRRGVEIAIPASDVGVDMLAYQLAPKQRIAHNFVPIQVKARSETGYNFQKIWFNKVPDIILVHVWFVSTTPVFYIFRHLDDVEAALGGHAQSISWTARGGYSVTNPTARHLALMEPHKNQWSRILDQFAT
jgi:hypothetical protein